MEVIKIVVDKLPKGCEMTDKQNCYSTCLFFHYDMKYCNLLSTSWKASREYKKNERNVDCPLETLEQHT